MGKFCNTIKALKFCKCPPQYPQELPISSDTARRSPVDHLGFRFRCCWCIPLKPAAVIIGIVMMMWAFLQLTTADKLISNIFPNKDGDVFYYSKLLFLCLATGMLFSCGILLLGISMSNYRMVHVFIWYAFLYNITHAALSAAGFAMHAMRGNATGKHALRVVLGMGWNCLVFYFLMIVNSYKMLIWMPL